jgi:hypothetical protein
LRRGAAKVQPSLEPLSLLQESLLVPSSLSQSSLSYVPPLELEPVLSPLQPSSLLELPVLSPPQSSSLLELEPVLSPPQSSSLLSDETPSSLSQSSLSSLVSLSQPLELLLVSPLQPSSSLGGEVS